MPEGSWLPGAGGELWHYFTLGTHSTVSHWPGCAVVPSGDPKCGVKPVQSARSQATGKPLPAAHATHAQAAWHFFMCNLGT